MLDYQGNLQEQKVKKTSKVLSTIYSIPSYDLFDCHFGKLINICSLQTAEIGVKVDHVQLASKWKISLEAAKKTVNTTTQHWVRTILHDTLHRRFRTNNRQLRYRRLSHDVFTDTLEAAVISWHRKN